MVQTVKSNRKKYIIYTQMNMIELIFSWIHSFVVQKMCNTILGYYIKDVLGMPIQCSHFGQRTHFDSVYDVCTACGKLCSLFYVLWMLSNVNQLLTQWCMYLGSAQCDAHTKCGKLCLLFFSCCELFLDRELLNPNIMFIVNE